MAIPAVQSQNSMIQTTSEDLIRHPLIDPKYASRMLVPQPHQWQFVTSPSYATYFAGGYGSGKSFALVAWLAMTAFMNPPDTEGLLVLPTYKMLSQFLNRALLPSFKHLIVEHKIGNGVLHLHGGRRLTYRSGHDPTLVEGDNCAYAALDEAGLMKRDIYRKIVARVRDERSPYPRIGLTGVPFTGTWLQDVFEGRHDLKRSILQFPTHYNTQLPDGYIDNLKEAIPRRLWPLYLEGLFVTIGASVYPVFSADRHVVSYEWKHEQRNRKLRTRPANTGVVIDPSPRNPHVLFVVLLEEGDYFGPHIAQRRTALVFDELLPISDVELGEDAIRTERLCQMIIDKGYPIHWCIMDPAGKAVEATSGKHQVAIVSEMLDVNVEYTYDPRLRLIENGIEMVERMLDPLSGMPCLLFAESLRYNHSRRAVLNAIQHYHYAEAKDGKPISNQPVKDGVTDHAMDDIRYLAINYFPQAPLSVRIFHAA